jgi:hypothetical protein
MTSGTGPASLGIVLLYVALTLAVVAAVAMIHPLRWLWMPSRMHAARALVLAALVAIAGALLPAPDRHVEVVDSALDHFLPVWQFSEKHELMIHATPERVDAAIRSASAADIHLFRLLTWIRRPHLSGNAPENILNAPAGKSLLDVACATGFQKLADTPKKEIVIGSLVTIPDSVRALPPDERERRRAAFTPEAFRALAEPGFAKAAMNFALLDVGDGYTQLLTETRVFASDAWTRRRFAAYWRLIYPGSALIRRNWLAAIRVRAEATAP